MGTRDTEVARIQMNQKTHSPPPWRHDIHWEHSPGPGLGITW